MEVKSKLAHLLPHWIKHNASHAEQFGEWAAEARAAGLEQVASRLDAAAGLIRGANAELAQAQMDLPQGRRAHD
jgi:hypothetical protein